MKELREVSHHITTRVVVTTQTTYCIFSLSQIPRAGPDAPRCSVSSLQTKVYVYDIATVSLFDSGSGRFVHSFIALARLSFISATVRGFAAVSMF